MFLKFYSAFWVAALAIIVASKNIGQGIDKSPSNIFAPATLFTTPALPIPKATLLPAVTPTKATIFGDKPTPLSSPSIGKSINKSSSNIFAPAALSTTAALPIPKATLLPPVTPTKASIFSDKRTPLVSGLFPTTEANTFYEEMSQVTPATLLATTTDLPMPKATTRSSRTTTETFTISEEPATLASAEGVAGENCIWEPLKKDYQYLNIISNTTWFNWYMSNCFPKHIGDLLPGIPFSDFSFERPERKRHYTEKGCNFLKYYNDGQYIKVVTNTTWYEWYMDNCFPRYSDLLLPFGIPETVSEPTKEEVSTPRNCTLEQYFPDGSYIQVVTNATWFLWYMDTCFPKYIGKLLPMIPFVDGQKPTIEVTIPDFVGIDPLPDTRSQRKFCKWLRPKILNQKFEDATKAAWYPWYIYNCP